MYLLGRSRQLSYIRKAGKPPNMGLITFKLHVEVIEFFEACMRRLVGFVTERCGVRDAVGSSTCFNVGLLPES